MLQKSNLGVPTATSHLTIVSKVRPLGEVCADPGVVQGCVWLRTKPELTQLGPLADFSLGWVGEELESNVETELKRRGGVYAVRLWVFSGPF